MAASTTTIQGVVEQASQTGFKVNGEWHTISKWGPNDTPGPQVPPQGSQIVAVLNAKGFAIQVTVGGGTEQFTQPDQPPTANYASGGDTPWTEGPPGGERAMTPWTDPPDGSPDKDRRISRLACLKVAADLVGAVIMTEEDAETTVKMTVRMAAFFETWTYRKEGQAADPQ